MWAQMLKTQIQPGEEEALQILPQELDAQFRGDEGGPRRVVVLKDQKDESVYYTLVFFESEERARQYENSPAQQAIQQRMSQVWAGQPEYTDLDVVYEVNR